MKDTLWWAIQQGELDTRDPMSWPEDRRRTLGRILAENDRVRPGESAD